MTTYQHFTAYANKQGWSVKKRALLWRLAKKDLSRYESEGWPTLERDFENLSSDEHYQLKYKNPSAKMKPARRKVKNPKRGPRGTVDETAARELELYAENSAKLYPQKEAIIKNLQRKIRKGIYDAEKAVKLWRYWVDNAARDYNREFSVPGSMIFNVPTRDKVARDVARHEHGRITRGEYDNPRGSVHTKKFDRCVRKVKRRGKVSNAYAVCASRLPRGGVKKSHRRNPKIRYALFGRKGNSGPRYRWTGRGFSPDVAPATFATLADAQKAGELIYKQFHNQLIKDDWRLWAAEVHSTAMP